MNPRRMQPRPRAMAPSARGRNRLLAALPREAFAAIAPHLEPVELASGHVLHEPLAIVKTVYFPESAVLSVIAHMDGGRAIEVGTVGNEGFVGLGVLHGVDRSPTQCVAQVPGLVRALPVNALRAAMAEGGALRTVLLRYAHAYLTQVEQRLACSASHTVLERCARWLLAADDTAGRGTAPSGAFMLTQEYLAYMLGVRREGVSAAATTLRDSGVISFSRGRIAVLDRRELEAASCACYATVNREYRRVMGVGPVAGRA